MKANSLASSFAIIRPPGHHCNNDPNGFCVFNNVVIATTHAQKLGWKKGDYFKLVECTDGRLRLAKVDTLEEFLIKGLDNE